MKPGLRVQILLALAGVILVAYVPLFFAIAQVTRGTSLSSREETARSLGAVVYDGDGTVIAKAGLEEEIAPISAPSRPYAQAITRARTRTGGHALDVVIPFIPAEKGAVLVRIRTDEDATRTLGVVRAIALYMGMFALALLVFAYIALTRAMVRPIEELARAADRVARGARTFELPTSAARELGELGASVRAMALRLRADEQAMRAKIEELTVTTRRLGETREQLAGSERLASVGRLAAGVAHEIGNPIAAIMGMHDLLEDAAMDADERADFLRRMRKETERIHVVVRDLLDYARPEENSPSIPARASVAEVAGDALALVRTQKEWRDIEANVDVEDDLLVAISPQRLTQVLLNLLFNAGAALASTTENKSRTVRIFGRVIGEGTSRRVRIEVEDDGPGVAPDLRARIFDPFMTTKDVGAGSGLGLAVCRSIVEDAAGHIDIDPSYARGARFVVELPAAAPS